MKNKCIFYSSYITVFISFIAFQVCCSILIQPIQANAQPRDCEYISPIGVKRFTREEQRRHSVNSGQNLLCYAKVRNCLPINPDSDFIPQNENTVMCDVGPCSFHGECMCPTDPRECFRDAIDGRSSSNLDRQRMVKIDDKTSCQSIGPIKAKMFTREEQRHYRFNNNNYLCYSNVQNCRVNDMPLNTDIVICDTASRYCPGGFTGGILCACPTNLNECANDTIDGHSAYIGGSEMIRTDEPSTPPSQRRRPRGRGRD